MNVGAYFDDFHVGDTVVTPARTITETDIVLFAALSGDWHPMHTDAEYAKQTAYGQRIAHGLLTLAISSGLLFRAGDRGIPSSTLALWGVEKVRFVAATKIGDTLHVEGEVVQLTAIDASRGLITFRQRVVNQHDEEVLTYTSKLLVARRRVEQIPYDV
jgi:3-hydroxybutyryl-CoA dehydratase